MLLKNSFYNVIHRGKDTPLVFSNLLSSEFHIDYPVQIFVSLADENKMEVTKIVTTAVNDVVKRIFQSPKSRLTLKVESCCLQRPYLLFLADLQGSSIKIRFCDERN